MISWGLQEEKTKPQAQAQERSKRACGARKDGIRITMPSQEGEQIPGEEGESSQPYRGAAGDQETLAPLKQGRRNG